MLAIAIALADAMLRVVGKDSSGFSIVKKIVSDAPVFSARAVNSQKEKRYCMRAASPLN